MTGFYGTTVGRGVVDQSRGPSVGGLPAFTYDGVTDTNADVPNGGGRSNKSQTEANGLKGSGPGKFLLGKSRVHLIRTREG